MSDCSEDQKEKSPNNHKEFGCFPDLDSLAESPSRLLNMTSILRVIYLITFSYQQNPESTSSGPSSLNP